jgi:hypothetical protein
MRLPSTTVPDHLVALMPDVLYSIAPDRPLARDRSVKERMAV